MGHATGVTDEAVARTPDGFDTGAVTDFTRKPATHQKAEPVIRSTNARERRRTVARAGVIGRALALAAVLAVAISAPLEVLHAAPQAQNGRFLAKEDILLFGLGLKIEPAQQTIPKDIATIVSTMFVAPQLPGSLPPFAPDAVVMATLRGPTFPTPVELTVKPNTPFNIPPLTVAGRHTLDDIRLVSNGEVVLRGTPESTVIDVIDKLLITQVTARPLTAAEIREKGLVFDKSSFQAYNFAAAFAIEDQKIPINFTVVLPTLQGARTCRGQRCGCRASARSRGCRACRRSFPTR